MTSMPVDWRCANIRRFATMKTGHTPSRNVPEYWQDTTIPWFTLADVWQLRDGQQTYLGQTASSISDLGLHNSAAELLPAGTVVLSRTASVGFSGIMPVPMATSQDFWNWICGPELLPGYLNYQFKANAGQLRALNMGSTHQTIYQKDAAGIKVIVPPLAAQRGIVAYLDRETAQIDTLIAEQQRLIDLLRERKVGIVRHAIAPGAAWTRARVKHLAHTNLGKMLDAGRTVRNFDESAPYVRAADVLAGGAVNLTDLNQMPFSATELTHFDLRCGDVLLIEGGATVGRPGFMTEDAPGIGFQKTVNRLRCGPELDPRFAYWAMLALYEADHYSKYFSAVSFVHLTGEKLREMPLSHPGLDEQRQIAVCLDQQTWKIDKMIAETERFIELARERRTALITAAVTGQIDVTSVA